VGRGGSNFIEGLSLPSQDIYIYIYLTNGNVPRIIYISIYVAKQRKCPQDNLFVALRPKAV